MTHEGIDVASLTTAASEKASIEAFRKDVLEASMTGLVIVDFWSDRSGASRTLSPMLEKLVAGYAAKGVTLVKIDVDRNQTIAAQFRIQSIPTVYAVFQGQPVADLTPARGEVELKAYLDQILAQLPPGATGGVADPLADLEPLIAAAKDALAAGAFDEAAQMFAAVTAELPERVDLAANHARALLGLGQVGGAETLLDAISTDSKDPVVTQARAALKLAKDSPPVADLAAVQDRVATNPDDLDARFELAGGLMGRGDRDGAADQLLECIARDRTWNGGAARERLLTLFGAIGLDDPWVISTRRRLSTILFA